MRIFVALLAVSFGCGTDRQVPDPVDPLPATTVYLTPTEHLVRAAMALRGVRPTTDDLAAVAADPAQLPAIVDRYLDTPEFGATMKDLHNEVLLLRVEQTNMTFPNKDKLAGKTFTELNAVYDEPLRLIEDVIVHDQPYTDIVTADYTMANRTVADLWGLPHAGADDAWERAQFTDGRPASGILATSILYARWRSTGFNYNRGRANMISRSLLCHDFLTSDIDVDTSIDLSDPDIVADAVVKNPSCAGCHQTLDPLASYMFTQDGNPNLGNIETYPLTNFYQPNKINLWKTTNKRPPLFFGEGAPGMSGLGGAIASDPRFAQCAAKHFAAYLTERAQADLPLAWIASLQDKFVASNFSAKQLAKAVVLSDEFRIAGDTDAANADAVIGYQKVRPEQLARMIYDLTGFAWMTTSTLKGRGAPVGTTDLMQSDFIGFRVLAGGIDSYFVSQPVFTMNATSSLAARQLAAAAADFVVEHDTGATRTLFAHAPTSADEGSVRDELVHLHARIYGELVASDDPAIDETYALFADGYAASHDAKRAWKLTLVGMLSDLRALYY